MLSAKLIISAILVAALPTELHSVDPESIVGGTPVRPMHKYPWLVSLQLLSLHFCGGSLLNNNTIITAAHCSQIPFKKLFKVVAHRNRFQVSEAEEQALKFSVKSISVHPNYNGKTMANDVAIWKVELIQGDRSKIPAGMVELDDGTYSADNTTVVIAGWGAVASGGLPPRQLQETNVDIVPTSVCQSQYPSLHPSSICAASPGKDACQGDSGGPMFAQKEDGTVVLVGLTSYGEGCAKPNYSGVYTRITAVADWVKPQL